jgi:diacylglycerol kinase (ATP)
MKKIAVIINPQAGSNNKKFLQQLIQRLSDYNQVTLFETKKAGDATVIAKKQSKNFDIVAVAGGDGTVQEVINGISAKTILAIIPMGTANIIALEAGITKNINHLCKIILKGKIKKIHVPMINNRRFVLMTGVGFDAFIVNNINNNVKKIFGKIIFFIETLKQFLILKKPNIQVIANKKTFLGNWVLITNACHYAGPYQITKQTTIFNANLVGYIFTNLTRINFLYSLFLIIFFGDLSKSKKIITIKSDQFKIKGNNNIPVQCDGEIFNRSTLLIKTSKFVVNLLT